MKRFLVILALLTAVLLSFAAAETLNLPEIRAKIEIPKGYTVMTPDNLGSHTDWASRQASSADELAQQWRDDGILLCAVAEDNTTRIVVTAVQDTDAQQYFDIDQQPKSVRTAWKNKHLKGSDDLAGYTYSSGEWKNNGRYGYMLRLKYRYLSGSSEHRGYMMKTVRNGYTVSVDYQVYGRTLKNKDLNALTAVMKNFSFTQVLEKPTTAVPNLNITDRPPLETNSASFEVAGTATAGMRIVGLAMRMSSNDKVLVESTASKKGNFTLKFKLPNEGVWLVTLTAYNGNEVVEELVFDTTTYSARLLPVNLDNTIPAVVSDSKLHISGKTVRAVTVQCIVGDREPKQVRTNGTGKFKFDVDLPTEGEYEIVLVFQKKGLNTVRLSYHVSREMTEAQQHDMVRKNAIKPAYTTLTNKLKGYTGKTMGYNLYFVSAHESGNEYVCVMAMTQSKGGFKNYVFVVCDEDPGFEAGSKHKMYGKCLGSYEGTDGTSAKTYPGFKLLFWD